jgi:hypothetical protein
MVLVFVVMLPVMPIGAYIAFTTRMLYGFYDICGRLDGSGGRAINASADWSCGYQVD